MRILKEINQNVKIVSQVVNLKYFLSKIFVLIDLIKFIIIDKILESTIENLSRTNDTSSENETSDSDSEYNGNFLILFSDI